MLEGLRGEDSIAELCRKEGIKQNLFYRWSKEFLEAGKKRLAGDTVREATSDEVKDLRVEARQLKETRAEVLIENRLLKKAFSGIGRTLHEISTSEKLEIIELVEQSTLSVRRTLAPIRIPRSTFYDWYSRYQEGGIEALENGKPRPQRIWNKIPDEMGAASVNMALEESGGLSDVEYNRLLARRGERSTQIHARKACTARYNVPHLLGRPGN